MLLLHTVLLELFPGPVRRLSGIATPCPEALRHGVQHTTADHQHDKDERPGFLLLLVVIDCLARAGTRNRWQQQQQQYDVRRYQLERW